MSDRIIRKTCSQVPAVARASSDIVQWTGYGNQCSGGVTSSGGLRVFVIADLCSYDLYFYYLIFLFVQYCQEYISYPILGKTLGSLKGQNFVNKFNWETLSPRRDSSLSGLVQKHSKATFHPTDLGSLRTVHRLQHKFLGWCRHPSPMTQ